MKYFWATLSWIWSQRKFILITVAATLMFFAWLFPFGDMSDLATSTIARATSNQIYLQFKTMDLNLVPAPALSAREVSIETPAFPAIEASWLKISPSWLSMLFNVWTIKKAASGDLEAANKLQTRLGISVAAEGVLGADVDASFGAGKNDGGREHSKITLAIDKLDLAEVRKWADLSVGISGRASLDAAVQIAPGFVDQPEGDIELHVNQFKLPATTIMIPLEGGSLPMDIPTLTLSSVVMRGRLSGGNFVIEEGTFGKSSDPINGRIKGQIAMRLQPMGGSVQPIFGAYNFTAEINTTKQIDKDLGVAFILFDQAKTPTPTGSHFLFRAQGPGFGPPPSVTKLSSF